MQTIIEKAAIAVGLDLGAVDKGMNTLQNKMETGFTGIVRSVAAPALAALGGLATGDLVKQLGDEAMAMKQYADMVGMSTEQMSAWDGVAQQFGFTVEDLNDKMTDINDAMTDLAHNDSGVFKELQERGLMSIFRDDGSMKSTEEALLDLSDVVKNLGATEGSGLLKRLSISDPRMISMIMQGKSALQQYLEEQKQIGVYTEEDAELGRQFNVALSNTSRTLKLALIPVFRVLSPLMLGASKVIQLISRHIVALIPAIIAVATVLTARAIPAIILTGRALVAAFSWKKFGIVAAIAALGIALDDFFTYLRGGKSQFTAFWDMLFGSAEGAKAFIDELSRFAEVAVWIGGAIAALWGLSQVITIVQGAFEAMTAIMATSFGPVGLAITAVIGALWLLYQNWDTVTKGAAAAWQWLCDTLLAAWQGVTGLIDSWINNFIATWESIKKGIAETKAFFGFGGGGMELAAGGDTSSVSNTTAKQENNITIYGDVSKGTVDAATESMNDGFGGMVGNFNHG